MTDSARSLVVDNYDSFVYTIVGYLKTLGAAVTVVRNDAIDPGEAGVIDEYDGVLISPGPGAPADSGASEGMIRLCAEQSKPMFGVCLGMQALAEVFGATVSHAPTIMHGKTSLVEHIDDEIFEGVANPCAARRTPWNVPRDCSPRSRPKVAARKRGKCENAWYKRWYKRGNVSRAISIARKYKTVRKHESQKNIRP